MSGRGSINNGHSETMHPIVAVGASRNQNNERDNIQDFTLSTIQKTAVASAAVSTAFSLLFSVNIALADTWGRETEAPTLYTGESVEICVKRGPLGKCEKTVTRTEQNDNDKASRYLRPMDEVTRRKDLAMRSDNEELPSDTSELLKRLKQQTEENREKNAKNVATKTYLNNQGANFGPFDRSTLILNADGSTFTLLENPQAMRLKKQGYIKNKQFVKQPTQEVIDDALRASDDEGINGVLKAFGFKKSMDDLDDDIFLEAKTSDNSNTDVAPPSGGDSSGIFSNLGNKIFGSSSDGEAKEVAVAPQTTDGVDKTVDKSDASSLGNEGAAEAPVVAQISTPAETPSVETKSEVPSSDNGAAVETPAVAQLSAAAEAVPVTAETESSSSNSNGGDAVSADYFKKLFATD